MTPYPHDTRKHGTDPSIHSTALPSLDTVRDAQGRKRTKPNTASKAALPLSLYVYWGDGALIPYSGRSVIVRTGKAYDGDAILHIRSEEALAVHDVRITQG